MASYLGVARERGIGEVEIGAVQSIVMAVSAGRVAAQLREVRAAASRGAAAANPSPSLGTPGAGC